MATLAELKSLRPALDEYVDEYSDCVGTMPSQRLFDTYVSGQLGPAKRKNVEGIAMNTDVPPRTLQQFLGAHRWQEDRVVVRHRQRVRDRHSSDDGIFIVDESGFPKEGKHTVGVQRQWCGNSGKVDNCVVAVGLGYVHKEFYCLLDTELFMPEAWADDRERRFLVGVPNFLTYRPKWSIALGQLKHALDSGVKGSWVTADELYGRCSGFRNGVSELGLGYVVEIPKSLRGWTTRPTVELAGTITKTGNTLKNDRVAPGEKKARRSDKLWERGGPTWNLHRVKDTTRGPQIWNIRETRFYANENNIPGPEQRLIIAQNILTGEMKYFLSNVIDDTPVGSLVYVAFTRWYVEKIFKESKSRVGFDEFEVRTFLSVKRHFILSAISHLFLVEQTLRLKKKTPGWTVPQVVTAIEAQFDDEMSGRERIRQLKKIMKRINYYQKKNPAAAASHDDTQRDKLHDIGIDLRKVKRCRPPWCCEA